MWPSEIHFPLQLLFVGMILEMSFFAHTSLMPPPDPFISEGVVLLALKLPAHHNLTFVQFEGNSKSMIENLQFPPPIIPDFLLNEMQIVSSSVKIHFELGILFCNQEP